MKFAVGCWHSKYSLRTLDKHGRIDRGELVTEASSAMALHQA